MKIRIDKDRVPHDLNPVLEVVEEDGYISISPGKRTVWPSQANLTFDSKATLILAKGETALVASMPEAAAMGLCVQTSIIRGPCKWPIQLSIANIGIAQMSYCPGEDVPAMGVIVLINRQSKEKGDKEKEDK